MVPHKTFYLTLHDNKLHLFTAQCISPHYWCHVQDIAAAGIIWTSLGWVGEKYISLTLTFILSVFYQNNLLKISVSYGCNRIWFVRVCVFVWVCVCVCMCVFVWDGLSSYIMSNDVFREKNSHINQQSYTHKQTHTHPPTHTHSHTYMSL